MNAHKIEAIAVIRQWSARDGNKRIEGITTNCHNFDEYKALPAGIKFEGKIYGKAGWNSDLHICEYRTDVKLAFPKE